MNDVGGKGVLDPEERDFGFFCAWMAVRTVSRRAEKPEYPYPQGQMNGCSSSRRTTKVDDYLVVDHRESSRKGRENHEEEIDPKGSHLKCEMGQGRSVTRVMVAT